MQKRIYDSLQDIIQEISLKKDDLNKLKSLFDDLDDDTVMKLRKTPCQGRTALGWALYFGNPHAAHFLLSLGFPLENSTLPNIHYTIRPPEEDWAHALLERMGRSSLDNEVANLNRNSFTQAWALVFKEMLAQNWNPDLININGSPLRTSLQDLNMSHMVFAIELASVLNEEAQLKYICSDPPISEKRRRL